MGTAGSGTLTGSAGTGTVMGFVSGLGTSGISLLTGLVKGISGLATVVLYI